MAVNPLVSPDDRLRELGLVTPQLAQAKAVDNLSMPKDVANETLSVLEPKDLVRFDLIDALYNLTKYDWIHDIAKNELNKRCSLRRKGVRGRDDIVNVVQGSQQAKGALESFKENITSFFRSGT
jgi:hypothetical protein